MESTSVTLYHFAEDRGTILEQFLGDQPNNSNSLIPSLSLSLHARISIHSDDLAGQTQVFYLEDSQGCRLAVNGSYALVSSHAQASILLERIGLPSSWLSLESSAASDNASLTVALPEDACQEPKGTVALQKNKKRRLATSTNPQQVDFPVSGTQPVKRTATSSTSFSQPSSSATSVPATSSNPALNQEVVEQSRIYTSVVNDDGQSNIAWGWNAGTDAAQHYLDRLLAPVLSNTPKKPSFDNSITLDSPIMIYSKEWRSWFASAKESVEENPDKPIWPDPPLRLGWLDPQFGKASTACANRTVPFDDPGKRRRFLANEQAPREEDMSIGRYTLCMTILIHAFEDEGWLEFASAFGGLRHIVTCKIPCKFAGFENGDELGWDLARQYHMRVWEAVWVGNTRADPGKWHQGLWDRIIDIWRLGMTQKALEAAEAANAAA